MIPGRGRNQAQEGGNKPQLLRKPGTWLPGLYDAPALGWEAEESAVRAEQQLTHRHS